jgi:hypothetical protein
VVRVLGRALDRDRTPRGVHDDAVALDEPQRDGTHVGRAGEPQRLRERLRPRTAELDAAHRADVGHPDVVVVLDGDLHPCCVGRLRKIGVGVGGNGLADALEHARSARATLGAAGDLPHDTVVSVHDGQPERHAVGQARDGEQRAVARAADVLAVALVLGERRQRARLLLRIERRVGTITEDEPLVREAGQMVAGGGGDHPGEHDHEHTTDDASGADGRRRRHAGAAATERDPRDRHGRERRSLQQHAGGPVGAEQNGEDDDADERHQRTEHALGPQRGARRQHATDQPAHERHHAEVAEPTDRRHGRQQFGPAPHRAVGGAAHRPGRRHDLRDRVLADRDAAEHEVHSDRCDGEEERVEPATATHVAERDARGEPGAARREPRPAAVDRAEPDDAQQAQDGHEHEVGEIGGLVDRRRRRREIEGPCGGGHRDTFHIR